VSHVSLKGVTKTYAITSLNKRADLKRKVVKKWLGINLGSDTEKVRTALKDVSVELVTGQSLAVIGRNGVGKSTLLKIIAGTLSADKGQVDVQGRVGGLIELSAGLNPLLTGLQNVEQRARALGVSQSALPDFISQVRDFAELEDQFDDPVATYSSGMQARLGFAIAVTLPFDIMVCDEALSVGDAKFASKCLARVNELKSSRVFIFVSHSMTMVQRFCDEAIVLDRGEVVFAGSATESVKYYENQILHQSKPAELSPRAQSQLLSAPYRGFLEPLMINREKIDRWEAAFEVGEGITVKWSVAFQGALRNDHGLRLGFPVFASDGTMLFSCTNESLSTEPELRELSGELVIRRPGLHPGVYYMVMALFEGMAPVLRQYVGEIRIPSAGMPCFGVYDADHYWRVDTETRKRAIT
jgi:ABC-type polysaccharide/polyol phosphate transport system ATPase subunit